MFRTRKFIFTLRFREQCLKITNSKSMHSHVADSSPLQGVRVLDLTRIVAGPYCTMILSDLGAEVLKIERPGVGDDARKWGPPFKNNTSCYFIPINRNKKSVCVDMKSEEGRQILYKLAEKSDILVENYIPGKLDELKLGYDHIKAIAPHLIYCSVTGFGAEGPYKHKPGYDVIASSMGGLIHITGPENGEPVKPGVALVDLATGLYAHGAILAALLRRTKTGKGQKIDVNLLSTQLSLLINIGSNYLNAGKEATRWGTAHESIVPYQSFPTKDGFFTLGTGSESQYKKLCQLLNRPDLSDNEKFKNNTARVKNRVELVHILKSILATKSNKEWAKIFEDAPFPCGPVNSLEETFNDPHVKAIGLVEELQHPDAGTVRVVGPPVKFGDGGNCVRAAPPLLGQHTDEVLEDLLGFDQEKIEDLRRREIIQ